MGSEAEEEGQSTAPKLPLFLLHPKISYGGMGMITPPHHSASVPFRWEHEPGKPRQCASPPADSASKGLELPPRLINGPKLTPTAAIEGPYVGRSIFHSSRFTRFREVSFDGGESATVRGLVVSKRWLRQGKEDNIVVVGDDDDASAALSGLSGNGDYKEIVSTRKNNLGVSKARFNFWATMYEAVKHVIPTQRRNRQAKCKC